MLITLAIIGIVAALTIPSVVHNYQKHQLQTQFKKVYNTLSQAGMQMRAQGVAKDFGANSDVDGDGKITALDYLEVIDITRDVNPYYKFFRVIKQDPKEQWDEDELELLNSDDIKEFTAYNNLSSVSDIFSPFMYSGGVTLQDGTWLRLRGDYNCLLGVTSHKTWATSHCFLTAVVDINGKEKKPNKIGYDIFAFEITYMGNTVPVPILSTGAACDTSKKLSKSRLNQGDCYSAFALADRSPEDPSKSYFKDFVKF